MFVTILLLISCSKGKETDPTEYLTKSSWKIAKLDYKTGSTGTWTDGFAALPPCKKDDEVFFQTSGVYLVTEGASKCSPADPTTVTASTWSFSADKKKIIFPPPSSEWTIEKLDDAQLIFTYSIDTGPVTNYYRIVIQH
jgi:hypothetical protein